MSSEPSLLDEDVSLLQQDTPKFERSVHHIKPSCSSSKDNGNKENMSMNKEEVPMLSMEPISMKRKKKGGGYNLRKSLAWDRAFLTEEGILDPTELSVISGTCSNNGGQALSVIAEVGSYFKRVDSQNMISSPSSRSHQRKKALQKMSTVHCSSGSGAKSSGCPRPSPTSSLKRHAFVNTSRSSSKELKFSKTAIPKPSMCSIPRMAKSSISSETQLQHNQFVQSAADKQTCTGSSKISPIKNTPQVKAGSAVSPSTSSSKLLKGNSATTALPLHPSTRVHQPPVSKVSNTCFKKNPREVDALGVSHTKGNGSVDIAPVPQRTTAGKSMHHAQFQAKKPSGLRMPSPSLGFFSQPKVSIQNQPTLMSFKPNMPGLSNVRDHREGKILHDTKSTLSTMPLRTTEKLALSDGDGVQCETSKSVLEQNTNKFVHAEISNDEVPMHGVDAIDKVDNAQHETGVAIILKGGSEGETSESVLEQNMNKSEHTKISYDELPMQGADDVDKSDVDKSDKVHAQHETSGRIVFKEASEHKISVTGFLPQPEDGDMKKGIKGFQACKRNDTDSTCSLSTCQKLSALSGKREGEIICNSAVTSLSFTSELPFAAEDIVPDKKSSTENHHELPMESCYQSPDQNIDKSEHDDISYDELAMHGAGAVDKSDKVHAHHEARQRITFKAVTVHKINATELLPQPEDGVMEKSIQGFQSCRSNDCDSTCSPSLCQKLSALSGQHEGEVICNSAVTRLSFTCKFPLEAEDVVPDKKSTTANHGELPMKSCYQSLEQSDDANFSASEVPDSNKNNSASEVPDSNKNNSASEVPEDNTCKDVEVFVICGEMKCQAPESCDSEPESSCFMSSGKYNNCSTDAGSRTKVDHGTYLGGVQSYAVKGMQLANFPKNHLNVKAVTADMEYSEKHWEAERIHIAVEESSHCNLELGATGDSLPEREPVQEKVVEVPSPNVPKESGEQCENTSCIKKFSLQGAITRENSPSSQHKFDELENNLLEDEDNAEILFKFDTSDVEELIHNAGSISTEKIKNYEKNLNKIDGQLILPKDLVPFSEEWLAAIEAAGEDVLTRKTGAVQNSPPDKSLPEPGPWSPVKRKTNQLGPFDCTKYTNPVPSDSPQ